MRFQGKLYKDGKLWLVEVPVFAAMTQGRTRKEALEMIADWFATMIDRPGFAVTVYEGKQGNFELSASDTKAIVGLLLQRQRQLHGLGMVGADSTPTAVTRKRQRTVRSSAVCTIQRSSLSSNVAERTLHPNCM